MRSKHRIGIGMTAKNKSATTPERIAGVLREDISRGALQPGQALRQDDLARRFGVSRIPVREALRRLEEDGLVRVEANRGTFVTTLDDGEVVEAYDLRSLLESDLAKHAVARLTAKDMLVLERAVQAAEKGAASADWNKLDNDFHLALYGPAQRPRQLDMVMALRVLVQRSHLAGSLRMPIDTWLADHREMLEACRAGDADKVAGLIEADMARDAADARERLSASESQGTGIPYYDEVRWRKAMLDIRPNCECCDRDLPNGDPAARICTFECTFCADCADNEFSGACPNCGGDLVPRPTRPAALLEKAPVSTERVIKSHRQSA